MKYGNKFIHFQLCNFKMQNKEVGLEEMSQKNNRPTSGLPAPKYIIADIISELQKREALRKDQLLAIIAEANSILKNQPTILKLISPIIIVGDIHGQFYDLIHLFEKFGYPPQTKYLFLGDYVDRGKFCIEVITTLLAMKISYPQSIYLLRGNHEGKVMTTSFNFKSQCEVKYQSQVYDNFIDLFTSLPLCAVINQRYFAVHGGLSPAAQTLQDISKINRFTQIPEQGMLCDLLWSDPLDQNHENWTNNKNRSCSYFYSRIQSSRFLNTNSLRMIIRGHEVQMKGFKYQMDVNNEPLTLTVFSAPRYCDTYRNKGAVAVLQGKNVVIQSFKEVEHPFVLNNYLNAFQLSIPMLVTSVTKVFSTLLKNKKWKKKNIKCLGQAKEPEFQKTINHIETVEAMFSDNVDKIQLMLQKTNAETPHDQTDADTGICESLMELLMMKNQQHLIERMPVIFGPKSIEFVKVKVNCMEEDDDPTEE